jgi:hypothetical protein
MCVWARCDAAASRAAAAMCFFPRLFALTYSLQVNTKVPHLVLLLMKGGIVCGNAETTAWHQAGEDAARRCTRGTAHKIVLRPIHALAPPSLLPCLFRRRRRVRAPAD